MITRLLRRIRQDADFDRLLRNAGVLYAGGMVSVGLTIAQQLTTAGALGAADYGRLATVVASASLLLLLLDVRTWEIGTKVLSRPIADGDHAEVSRATRMLLRVEVALGVAGAMLLVALADPIADRLLDDPGLDGAVRAFALVIPLRMVSNGAGTALIRLYGQYRWLAVKSVAYAALRLVLLTGVAVAGGGVTGVVAAAVACEAVNAVSLVVLSRSAWRSRAGEGRWLDPAAPRCRTEAYRLMPTLWLSASLKALQLETMIPLTAALATPADVGVLRLGMDIADVTTKATAPLTLVLFPSIVAAFDKGRAEAVRLMRRSTALLASIVVPICIGVVVVGPFVYPHVFGDDFADLAWVASLLTIGFTANAIGLTLRPAVIALDAAGAQNAIGLALTAVTLPALALAAAAWGAIGSAAAMMAFLLAYPCGSYLLVRRRLRTAPERIHVDAPVAVEDGL